MDATISPARWELAPPADGDVSEAVGDARPEADVDGYLTAVQAADELAGLQDALDTRERAQREIVGRLDRLVRSGRIEQLEGLTPELFLTLVHRQSGWTRGCC